LRGLRVLVVDDNRNSAETLAALLQEDGADVRVALDGGAALLTLRNWAPSAALLDIAMPGLDGYEIARRVRADVRTCETLLVAISGWSNDDDRRRSHAAGFDHHLNKPVAYARLKEILAAARPGGVKGASPPPPA